MSATAHLGEKSTSGNSMALRHLLDSNVISEAMRPALDSVVMKRLLEVGDIAATG